MRQIEHFEIMVKLSNKPFEQPIKEDNEIRILRTLEYTENGTSETFNIGTNGEDYGAELTREQMRELYNRIGEILDDEARNERTSKEDTQRAWEERQKKLSGNEGRF